MNKRLMSPLGQAGRRIATPRVPFPGCRPCPSHAPKPHAHRSTGVPAAFCDWEKSRKAGARCMHGSSGSLAEGAPPLLMALILHLEHRLARQNPRHKAKIKGLCITLKNASGPSLLQFNCTSFFHFPSAMASTQWWLTPLHLMLSRLSPHQNAAMGEKVVGAPPGALQPRGKW